MFSIVSKTSKSFFRDIKTSLSRNMSNVYNKHSIKFKEDGVINHETLVTNEDYPINKCRGIIQNKTITVLGYGPQGRSQAMNIKDNNLKYDNGCFLEVQKLFNK